MLRSSEEGKALVSPSRAVFGGGALRRMVFAEMRGVSCGRIVDSYFTRRGSIHTLKNTFGAWGAAPRATYNSELAQSTHPLRCALVTGACDVSHGPQHFRGATRARGGTSTEVHATFPCTWPSAPLTTTSTPCRSGPASAACRAASRWAARTCWAPGVQVSASAAWHGADGADGADGRRHTGYPHLRGSGAPECTKSSR